MFINKQSRVTRILMLTLSIQSILLLFKLAIAFSIGSLSLQIDVLHSSLAKSKKLFSLIADRSLISGRNREYPYGYQKFEALAALGTIACLAAISWEILQKGIIGIFYNNYVLEVSGEKIGLLALILGINILITCWEWKIGKQIKSDILITNARYIYSTIWLKFFVLIEAILLWQGQKLYLFQFKILDVILALIIACLVCKKTGQIFKYNLAWLVDEIAIAPEEIKKIVIKVPGVIDCYNIASRGLLSKQVFVEMKLIVKTNNLKIAYKISKQVEYALKQKFPRIQTLINLSSPAIEFDRPIAISSSRK